MKKISVICAFAFALVSCSGELGGRIDQYAEVPVPGPVSVKDIRSIPGGGVIKVTIPDDENLKGIVAEYERNGELVNTKISRYVDSLTVEGLPIRNLTPSPSIPSMSTRSVLLSWRLR